MRLDPSALGIGLRILCSAFSNPGSSGLNLISCRVLGREANELHKRREKATWKKILENEQDAKAIQDTIQRIDEALQAFQVCRRNSQHCRVC
jgi:hypothetical protein